MVCADSIFACPAAGMYTDYSIHFMPHNISRLLECVHVSTCTSHVLAHTYVSKVEVHELKQWHYAARPGCNEYERKRVFNMRRHFKMRKHYQGR